MFDKPVYLGAIELGTSQVNVLLGKLNDDKLEIIGRGTAPSNGSVEKGSIRDMERSHDALAAAIDQMEKASPDARTQLSLCSVIVLVISGCGIDSLIGVGSANIQNEKRIVTEKDRDAAGDNAATLALPPGRVVVYQSPIDWSLDGRRTNNPVQQRGLTLMCRELIVHGNAADVCNFGNVLKNYGLERDNIETIFAPLASQFGIASDAECDNGVVLVDLGAGTADYAITYDGEPFAVGTIPLGFEHVANDLSIGLDLPIDVCRKIFEKGTLADAKEKGVPFLEFELPTGGKREIPVSSFDTIIDVRLREIFTLVKRRVESKCSGVIPGSYSGILTGGGALYPESLRHFTEVFEFSTRIGSVADAAGAVTGINSPRYSAVWGALKGAACFYNQGCGERSSWLDRSIDSLNHFWGDNLPSLSTLKKAFKF